MLSKNRFHWFRFNQVSSLKTYQVTANICSVFDFGLIFDDFGHFGLSSGRKHIINPHMSRISIAATTTISPIDFQSIDDVDPVYAEQIFLGSDFWLVVLFCPDCQIKALSQHQTFNCEFDKMYALNPTEHQNIPFLCLIKRY